MASNCIYCGAALEDGATFCKSCGKPASLFTPTPEPQNTQTSGDMPAAESYQEQPQQQVQQPGATITGSLTAAHTAGSSTPRPQAMAVTRTRTPTTRA